MNIYKNSKTVLWKILLGQKNSAISQNGHNV